MCPLAQADQGDAGWLGDEVAPGVAGQATAGANPDGPDDQSKAKRNLPSTGPVLVCFQSETDWKQTKTGPALGMLRFAFD